MGHLRQWDQHFNGDDEELVRYILKQHENSVTHTLKEENKELKAKLYDLMMEKENWKRMTN